MEKYIPKILSMELAKSYISKFINDIDEVYFSEWALY